jgi:hypothetical protein
MIVTMKLTGDKEFKQKVTKIINEIKDPVPLYKSWGMETLKWVQQNYREGGGKLITGKWRKLSRLTVMSRRKGSSQPLMDTGHMLRQWNYKVLHEGVEIGNPMQIAEYHETGTRPYVIKPKNRRFLWFGVTPADRRRGQQLGGYHQWRVASKPYRPFNKTPGIFAREVHHPGLTARRQLPNEIEIMPTIVKVTDAWLQKVINR